MAAKWSRLRPARSGHVVLGRNYEAASVDHADATSAPQRPRSIPYTREAPGRTPLRLEAGLDYVGPIRRAPREGAKSRRQVELAQDRLVLLAGMRLPVCCESVAPPCVRELAQLRDSDRRSRIAPAEPAIDVLFRPEEIHRASGEDDVVPPTRGGHAGSGTETGRHRAAGHVGQTRSPRHNPRRRSRRCHPCATLRKSRARPTRSCRTTTVRRPERGTRSARLRKGWPSGSRRWLD